jgi:hypothetical protein
MGGFRYPRVGGDGMVFREDFYSSATVAGNGGIVTGPLRIVQGAVPPTSNTCKIVYPGTSGLIGGAKKCTIIVDLVTPADVAPVTDLFTSFATGTSACRFSTSIYDGYIQTLLFTTSVGGNCVIKTPVAAGVAYRFALAFDGDLTGNARAVPYLNGKASTPTYAGSVPAALLQGTSPLAILTQEVSGLRSIAGTRMLGVRLYNRAFSASDVREDYLEARS